MSCCSHLSTLSSVSYARLCTSTVHVTYMHDTDSISMYTVHNGHNDNLFFDCCATKEVAQQCMARMLQVSHNHGMSNDGIVCMQKLALLCLLFFSAPFIY